MRPLRIFTWHVHGSYLYYLARCGHELWLPVREGRPPGYCGRTRSYPWPSNVHEIAAEDVPRARFDCVLHQSHANWLEDQFDVLSAEQRRLPRIFLEHDPPRQHPTDTQHPVDDPDVLLVHVTPFNQLMWDSRRTPTCVVEHGVEIPDDVTYSGELARAVVVVNNIRLRGRRLGSDVLEQVRTRVPLDLVGMGWESAGGIGEIPHHRLPAFMARYRVFFNPIRYTSLGLSVIEAMMAGLPVVGLATTEMVTAIENGVSGVLDTRIPRLVDALHELLDDRALARTMGAAAREQALERYHIERFAADWRRVFADVTATSARRTGVAS